MGVGYLSFGQKIDAKVRGLVTMSNRSLVANLICSVIRPVYGRAMRIDLGLGVSGALLCFLLSYLWTRLLKTLSGIPFVRATDWSQARFGSLNSSSQILSIRCRKQSMI